MKLIRQAIVALAVLAGAVALWIAYVPEAQPWLARLGVYDALGIVAPDSTGSGAANSFRRPGGPIAVVAKPVVDAMADDRASAIGNGRALRSVVVTPQVSGRIVSVDFTSGARVRAGQVLAQLDDAAQKIALDKARLVLADAQDKEARLEKLAASGTASDTQIRDARLAVRTAELAVRQAEFDLSLRQITAPIDGWIGLRSAEVGDQVTTSTALAQIDDRSSLLVDFRIPERYVTRIRPGETVQAAPLAQPDRALSGVVKALDNRVDEASRTILVEAEFPNSGDSLRPGMAFSIALRFEGESYPAVAPLAIQWSSEGSYVWAVRDGKAARLPARIVQRSADQVLVAADLKPGDMVITEGVQMLRPGADVAVLAADPLAPGQGGAPAPANP